MIYRTVIIPILYFNNLLNIKDHESICNPCFGINGFYFSQRKGRRNTIYRVDKIVETVKNRRSDKYAVSVPLQHVSAESLSPAFYIQKNTDRSKRKTLSSLTENIFRSQRVESNTDSNTVFYSEIGMKNIMQNSYTVRSKIKRHGKKKRVETFKLEKLDILIPLRGSAGSVDIVGKHKETLVCNAGLICASDQEKRPKHMLSICT